MPAPERCLPRGWASVPARPRPRERLGYALHTLAARLLPGSLGVVILRSDTWPDGAEVISAVAPVRVAGITVFGSGASVPAALRDLAKEIEYLYEYD